MKDNFDFIEELKKQAGYNSRNIVGEQPDWKPPRGVISEKPDVTGDDLIDWTKKRRGY